ncbi:unnamed protein product [Malus baccata var. baccata]
MPHLPLISPSSLPYLTYATHLSLLVSLSLISAALSLIYAVHLSLLAAHLSLISAAYLSLLPSSSKIETQSENQDNEPINLDLELNQSESSFDDTGRKRKRTSVVWQHFEEKKKSQVITGDGSVKHGAYSFDEDNARKELTYMILLHEYSLSMVDHLGFKRFCNSLQPLFKAISRNTIKRAIMTWNVDGKLSTLTVDNCSTNDAMIEDIVTYCKLSLVLNGELFHMRCCAHILNLIVKDELDVIRDSIETLRNSVAYWSIRIAICKWLESDHVEVKLMATKMSIKFEKYWHKIHGAMAIAAIMDPRFKMKLIKVGDPLTFYDQFVMDSTIDNEHFMTIASESSFSTGDRIFSPHCSQLHSSTVEALMCSRDWLWSQMRVIGDTNSVYEYGCVKNHGMPLLVTTSR